MLYRRGIQSDARRVLGIYHKMVLDGHVPSKLTSALALQSSALVDLPDVAWKFYLVLV